MDGKDGKRETLTYIVIAFFVIIVIIFAVIFSNNELELAYIHHNFLGENWHEDIAERETGSHLFGLEKFGSLTYKINDKYPASLTVTTIKTLVMMKENELREKTAETIHQALEGKIVLNKDTEVIGERVLKNGHKTMYFVYDGNDTSKNPSEKIKIIGEVWNCGTPGTSIISIGVAQVTNNAYGDSNINFSSWRKIVMDEIGTFGVGDFQGEDGLIYNVICHAID